MNRLLRMNLQFFSEDTGANGGGDNPDNAANTETQVTDFDNLSDEQVQSFKEKFGFKSDEEVNSLIDNKFAKWQEKTEKEKSQAEELAKMSEKDRYDFELKKRDEEIAEYKREKNLLQMSETASGMLTEKGVTASKEVLGLVVSEDAEVTSNNVKAYLNAIELEREAIKADFEKRLGGKEVLDGTGKVALSRGAQLAKEANEQNKPTQIDAWGK